MIEGAPLRPLGEEEEGGLPFFWVRDTIFSPMKKTSAVILIACLGLSLAGSFQVFAKTPAVGKTEEPGTERFEEKFIDWDRLPIYEELSEDD